MIYSEVKHTKDRMQSSYDSTLNIQRYGHNNLYPQEMNRLVNASGTGGVCLERYATFIEGNGFNDVAFSEFVVNKHGETVDDVLHSVSWDMARYGGFALHVNYNAMCEICSIHYVPFECCRLEEENEDGSVTHIVFHPDWTGAKTRKGNKLRVTDKNVIRFYQFNPKKEVVLAQIVASGGINQYMGQMMWVSTAGKNRYPIPIYDKVVTNLSTDEGLDNVKYRSVRNNFMPSGMLVRRRGTALTIDDSGNKMTDEQIQEQDERGKETLETFMGDENTGSIMEVYLVDGESEPVWKPIENENFALKFEKTSADISQRIYSAFGQEPWYSLRVGKTGFSGDVLADAYDYYNSYVETQRRFISRAFKQVFLHWQFNVNYSKDYTIEPLVFVRQKWANLNQPVN